MTGNLTISGNGGATDRTLTIGSGGVSIASNSRWTVGSSSATNRVNVLLDGSQIWSGVNMSGGSNWNIRNLVSRVAGDTTNRTLTIDAGSNFQQTVTLGDVRDGGGSGSLSLWQTGLATLSFGTSASYTGRTTLSAGKIVLGASSLPTSGTLALRGTWWGSNSLYGVNLQSGSYALPTIAVETGMNSFGFATSGGNATSGTVNLGTITRTGGVVQFNNIGTGSTAYLISSPNNAAGILGAWAVAGTGTTWVTNASGTLAQVGYTSVTESGLTSTNGIYGIGDVTLTAPRSAYVITSTNNFGRTVSLGSSGANDLTVSGFQSTSGNWNISRGGSSSGRLVIGQDNELIFAGGSGYSISVPIVDGTAAGRVTFASGAGAANVTLSGSNSYSGGTVIAEAQAVSVNLNNPYAIGSGTLWINPTGQVRSGIQLGNSSGAAITLATNNAQSWDGNFQFSGPSDLNMGTGTVSLGATPNASRTVAVNAGTLTIGGRIVDGSHSDLPTKSLTVSGSALGRLLLTGSNGYTGVTTVNGGILEFATRNAIYGGDTSKWTATNLTTGSGGVMALDVGAAGQFTATDLDTFKVLGTGTSGFLPGSFLGIDTTTVASGTYTYASNIANPNGGANALGIAKIGSGTLILSGNNTMTGGVSVRGGMLLLTAANQMGTGPITLFSGTLSTSSDAFMNGTASPLTFSGGALQVTGTTLTSLATGRTTTFTAGAATTFDITDAANTFTVSQAISSGSAGSLVKLGPGTLVLSASSNYTGSTVIGSAGGPTGGTLRLSGTGWISGTTGTAGPVIYAGTLDTNGINVTTAAFTLGGGAAATTAGVTTGSGTLTLGGGVTYDATNNPGGATIAGNLSLGNANRTFTVGDSTGADTDLTISAAITSGTLTKAGAGVLLLSGTNTYSGTTTVSAGVLSASSTASLPGWDTGRCSVSGGGALALGSGFSDANVATVLGSGTWLANSSIGFDTTGADRNYGSVIGNSGANARGLTKLGSGTLTLSAANTYTGTTSILAGTLAVGIANALPSTSPIALAGGVLNMTNSSSSGAVTVSAPGSSIIGNGTLSGSSYTFSNASGAVSASAILGGTAATLTKSNAGTATLTGLSTYGGITTVSGGVLEFNSIANSGTTNASALGAPAAANSAISLGSGTSPATLRYTGTGHASNRAITLGGTTLGGGGTIDASSFGALDLSSGTVSPVGASNTTLLTLTGTSTALNTIGTITGTGVSVVKDGTGLWRMNANKGFGGTLTVKNGTLQVANAGAVGNAVTVGDAAPGAGGLAALLLEENVTASFDVITPAGTQAALFGGANTTGTATLSSGEMQMGRATTLVAKTGGTVDFRGTWAGATSGSPANQNVTIGAAGYAGRFLLQSSGTLATSGSVAVQYGTAVLGLTTTVSAAGTLATTAGATLAGTGIVTNAIGGAGVISPGNSPGILTAGSLDPGAGIDFIFEITGAAPDFTNRDASVNDVLRLTDLSAPFASALGTGNVVNVLFNLSGTAAPVTQGTYTGGFFTDSNVNFFSSISSGSFAYWVSGTYGTGADQQQFAVGPDGSLVTYSRLGAFDPALSVQRSVVPQTVTVTGQITQFVVVPEPTTLALAGIGIAMSGYVAWRRRR
jgi:autotransporter-associated beta strand protein